MKTVNVIIMGFGRVGRAFWQIVSEKRLICRERYGLDFDLKAVFKSDGGAFNEAPLPLETFLPASSKGLQECVFWKPGLRLEDVLEKIEPGVLVECSSSDLRTGEPDGGHLATALTKSWHAACASKGGLLRNFPRLMDLAEKKGVELKYGGATAAALPTLDVGLVSLAGTEILGIEGVLNGTTNYILTRMAEGMDYAPALQEAQAKGIAEPDPKMDIDGWDTACKLILISNAVAGTGASLDDVKVEGIRDISHDLVVKARQLGKTIKLMGKCSKEERTHPWKLEVGLALLDSSHPLFCVAGTNKGVTFYTDTMGAVTLAGGKSDPRGTAAALLKDIINIFR